MQKIPTSRIRLKWTVRPLWTNRYPVGCLLMNDTYRKSWSPYVCIGPDEWPVTFMIDFNTMEEQEFHDVRSMLKWLRKTEPHMLFKSEKVAGSIIVKNTYKQGWTN